MLYTVCLLLAAAASSDSGPATTVPTYTIETVAGGKPVASASTGQLRQPSGVLLSLGGDIYFSDAMAHLVRRVDASGKLTTIAGTGVAGFSGDGGPAFGAQLNQPYGLAADANGNLYVADLGNGRIRVVAPDGTIRTFAGGGTAAGGSTAATIKLNQPRNVAVGVDGSVYFSDFGAHQVYRVSQGVISVVAGTGTQGGSGDGGAAALATLAFPAGLATTVNGDLYVADSGNNRIRKISNGTITSAGSLKRPTGVAVDFYGNLYVAGADTVGLLGKPSLTDGAGANDIAVDLVGNIALVTPTAVEHVDQTGNTTIVLGSNGPKAGSGDTAAGPTSLILPAGLAIDATGKTYIADAKANVVWSLNSSGILTVAFGTGDPRILNAPGSVAVDRSGGIYIADTGNNRVVRAGAEGKLQTIVDQLKSPAYVFADSAGLLIADTGNDRVLVVGATGAVSSTIPVAAPVAAIRDSNGNIYVSQRDAGQVVRWAPNGWTTPVLLDGKSPSGLALDAAGRLVVADSGHNTIRLVASDGSYTTLAGTGIAGNAGDGGPATAALLSAPSDVRVDAKGQIWIADSLNGAIRVLVPATVQPVVPPPSYSAPFRVVSSASFAAGAIASGEIVSVFGSGFNPKNVQVTFDGAPAFQFYSSDKQINLLVPKTVKAGTSTTVTVISDGNSLGTVTADVVAAAPGLFTFGSGTGEAAALNQDTSVNGASNAAAAGSIIVLYATGNGPGTVAVSIGGKTAEILYAGDAPGYVGLMQINARIPATTAPGAVPVAFSIDGIASQDGVTIEVK